MKNFSHSYFTYRKGKTVALEDELMLLSFSYLVIIFVIYSILGWIIEALLESLINSKFLNRGLLFGPWMPTYGIGAVIILVISRLLIDFPILVFLSSALIGTLIYN